MKKRWVWWIVSALVLLLVVALGLYVFYQPLSLKSSFVFWDELPSFEVYPDLERYGGWEQTRAVYDSLLSAARAQGERKSEWQTLLKIGILHESCGNLDSAEVFLKQGMQLAHNPAAYAFAAMRLGVLYGKLGDLNQAEEYLEMAREMGYTSWQDSMRVRYLFYRANLLFMQDSLTPAIAHYQQALPLYQSLNEPRGEWACDVSLGAAYTQQGDSAAAVYWYDRADSSQWGLHDLTAQAVNALQRGELQRKLGQASAALQEFRSARTRLEDLYGHDLEAAEIGWQARLGEARCLWVLGMRPQARQAAEAGVHILEDRTLRVSGDALKRNYLEYRNEAFAEVVGIYLGLQQYREAMAAAERGRSRAFLDLLQERGIHLRAADEDSLAPLRKRQYQQQLFASLGEASLDTTTTGVGRGSGQRSSPDHDWSAGMTNLSPELRSLSAVVPVTFAALTNIAKEKQSTLLEYFVMPDSLAIFMLTPRGRFTCRTVRVSRDSLDQEVTQLLACITAPPARTAPWRQVIPVETTRSLYDAERGSAALHRLYDWLIQPVEAELPADTNEVVTIIPHGPLFLAPFPALLDTNQHFLIEKHALSTVPSAGVLQFTGQKRGVVVSPHDPYVLVAGDPAFPPNSDLQPLPGARAEAGTIAQLFVGEHVRFLQDSAATESEIKKAAPAFTILHFATHGLLDEKEPMLSALAFSPDSLDDGFLTCAEIFALPQLHADLIVMSACQTGRGAVTGDGILGLSRAFLYAGTPALIATQWNIDDESTSYLMREFYAEYLRTGRKALALRTAQMRTLAKYPAPFYWAAFVLVGED